MRGKEADLQRLFHIAKWSRKLQGIQSEVQTYEQFTAKKNIRLVELSAFYIGQIGEHARNITEDAPILAERCLEVLRLENSNVDAELEEELSYED